METVGECCENGVWGWVQDGGWVLGEGERRRQLGVRRPPVSSSGMCRETLASGTGASASPPQAAPGAAAGFASVRPSGRPSPRPSSARCSPRDGLAVAAARRARGGSSADAVAARQPSDTPATRGPPACSTPSISHVALHWSTRAQEGERPATPANPSLPAGLQSSVEARKAARRACRAQKENNSRGCARRQHRDAPPVSFNRTLDPEHRQAPQATHPRSSCRTSHAPARMSVPPASTYLEEGFEPTSLKVAQLRSVPSPTGRPSLNLPRLPQPQPSVVELTSPDGLPFAAPSCSSTASRMHPTPRRPTSSAPSSTASTRSGTSCSRSRPARPRPAAGASSSSRRRASPTRRAPGPRALCVLPCSRCEKPRRD